MAGIALRLGKYYRSIHSTYGQAVVKQCCVLCVYPEYRNAVFSGSLHLWSGRQQLFLVVCSSITQESAVSTAHFVVDFSELLRKDDK